MALYYIPQFATTTLNVPGGLTAVQTTGIILNSVPSDIDITKPGIVCLTYTNPINTDNAEWITYTSIDGTNTLQGVARGAEGYAAKTHSNGCTVAWVVSKSHVNNINDILAEVTGSDLAVGKSASQTLTNKTLTSPTINTGKIGTSINDTNGNELVKVTATASAVNEITVANAATGNSPVWSVTGGDTNVGWDVKMKGAAYFRKPTLVEIPVFTPTTQVTTGDGKSMFRIPEELNGMNLTGVAATVYTAGTTGTTDIQIRNVTDSQDMLSTKMTIDSAEVDTATAATPAVINTSYDDVATADRIAIDVDAVSTTAPYGLVILLRFELPA